MSRLSGANATEVVKPHIEFAALVDMDFASGHVYLNSRDHNIDFNGHTYLGFGRFGAMGDVTESGDLAPDKIEFTLNAVDSSLLTTALAENYHGRSVTVHIAYLKEDLTFVDTPFLLWEGEMDTMTITADEGALGIKLIAENRLIRWNRSSGWLYTQEHQDHLTKTGNCIMADADTILDQISSTIDKTLKWYDHKVQNWFKRSSN